MATDWIRKAVKRPGRVHRYIVREYGEDCINEDGTIKVSCLDQAIEDVKERCQEHPSEDCYSLLRALELARTFKRWNR